MPMQMANNIAELYNIHVVSGGHFPYGGLNCVELRLAVDKMWIFQLTGIV
jgi:hypothetical protein